VGQVTPRIWRGPAIVASLTAIGLVSALVGDGLWDVLSWFALFCPLAVAAWYIAKAARTASA
jgi:hypothetical protein